MTQLKPNQYVLYTCVIPFSVYLLLVSPINKCGYLLESIRATFPKCFCNLSNRPVYWKELNKKR